MLFWLICALMTVVVTLVTLRPLMARSSIDASTAQADLNVYKDQLSEVDRDLARGILSETEADAARLEISRRILAADAALSSASLDSASQSDAQGAPAVTPFFTNLVFYLAAGIVMSTSVGLYIWNGAPGYAGRPHTERLAKPPEQSPVNELVARVEARLREQPNDGRGWDVLAPVYARRGQHAEAARAYTRAIKLLGETRARLRGLAEAHLSASNGIVTEEARNAFRKLLAKEPDLIAPRFWLAVGLEQDGDREGAANAYRKLLGETETVSGSEQNTKAVKMPGVLRKMIQERLAAVTGQPSMPSNSTTGDKAQSPPQTGQVPSVPDGTSVPQSAAARAQMIEQMVSGLAERLERDGGTLEEWQRLIRAYWVLKRPKDAGVALKKAHESLGSDATARDALDKFARELGLVTG